MNDVEFDDFCLAVAAVRDTLEGNLSRLGRRLDHMAATGEEVLIWAVLDPDGDYRLLKRPAHRPRKFDTKLRRHLHRRSLEVAAGTLGPRKGRNRRRQQDERIWQMKDVPVALDRWLNKDVLAENRHNRSEFTNEIKVETFYTS
jgi:hypothetical protein